MRHSCLSRSQSWSSYEAFLPQQIPELGVLPPGTRLSSDATIHLEENGGFPEQDEEKSESQEEGREGRQKEHGSAEQAGCWCSGVLSMSAWWRLGQGEDAACMCVCMCVCVCVCVY